MLNRYCSDRADVHLPPMRPYPPCQVLAVHNSRRMRMPASFFGEFRLHVVIDQVCNKDVAAWMAQAILVHLHSEPVNCRLG